MNPGGRPLEEHLPELASIRRVDLLDAPTPLVQYSDLGAQIGYPNLWVKRDDLSAIPYGGNKPRKLEYGLGEIMSKQSQTVVTIGGIGTNHGLATAIYCRQLGLRCHLVLFEQPITHQVQENLRLFHRFGASLQYASSYVSVGWHTARLLAPTWLGVAQHPAALLAPGGTSALTNLGFVNAALELHRQIRTLGVDPPSHVFCPLGSGGTMAGLMVGFRLCGLPTQVVGVRVVDRVVANRHRIVRLANTTLQLMRDRVAKLRIAPFTSAEVAIMDGFFGDRYGAVTSEGQQAVNLAARHGIHLETTYTGKAFAGLIQFAKSAAALTRPVVFWNTYNSRDVSQQAPATNSRHARSRNPDPCDPDAHNADWRDLPDAFHRFFDSS